MARNARALADVGGELLLVANLFSDEKYTSFGVEYFPSLQAVIEHQRCLSEMNWLQHMDSKIFLGTHWNPESFPINLEPYHPQPGEPAPIYKVFLWRNIGSFSPDNEEMQNRQAKVAAYAKELGVFTHISSVVSIQFNEHWWAWGLERYPSHEALEKHYRAMVDADWWRHTEARAYLGIATGGALSGLS